MLSFLNSISSPTTAIQSSIPLNILIGGDSIANNLVSTAQNLATFEESLTSYSVTPTLYDGAQGSLAVNSFINFSTQAKEGYYTALWDSLVNKDDIQVAVLSLGINDTVNIEYGTYTADEYRDNYIALSKLYSVNGTTFIPSDPARNMKLVDNAFGTKKGVTGLTEQSCFVAYEDSMTITNGFVLGFVVDFADAYEGSTKDLIGFGTTAYGYSTCRLYYDASNRLVWATASDGGYPNMLNGDVFGEKHAIILAYDGTTLDIYADDTTTPVQSITPNGYLDISTTFWINGRDLGGTASSDETVIGMLFAKDGAHDAGNDPSLSDIMSALKTYGGIV